MRLEELGLSLVQWDTLRHMAENPGASLHDLAQLTFQTDLSFGSRGGSEIDAGIIEFLVGPARAIKHLTVGPSKPNSDPTPKRSWV